MRRHAVRPMVERCEDRNLCSSTNIGMLLGDGKGSFGTISNYEATPNPLITLPEASAKAAAVQARVQNPNYQPVSTETTSGVSASGIGTSGNVVVGNVIGINTVSAYSGAPTFRFGLPIVTTP